MSSEAELRIQTDKMFPNHANSLVFKKAKYGEIHSGLELGGAYAFSKASYERFLPIGLSNNLELPMPTEKEWAEQMETNYPFLNICLDN